MSSTIYDKTDKGREEIATRKYQVASKLRTLLVMIDGRHTLESLLQNFAALGLSEDNVKELLGQGYIALVSGGPAANEPGLEQAAAPASARARMLARTRGLAAARGEMEPEEEDSPAAEAPPVAEAPPTAAPADGAERFRALYEFYNQTIKSSIGLRGFVLQLKVEKAAGVEDLRALRLPYLQAVLKANGREMTLSLRDRLDQLLGGTPAVDDFELPAD